MHEHFRTLSDEVMIYFIDNTKSANVILTPPTFLYIDMLISFAKSYR